MSVSMNIPACTMFLNPWLSMGIIIYFTIVSSVEFIIIILFYYFCMDNSKKTNDNGCKVHVKIIYVILYFHKL